MKDAKTRRHTISILATLLAFVILAAALGAVLVLDRDTERAGPKEPQASRSMEMVRPAGDVQGDPPADSTDSNDTAESTEADGSRTAGATLTPLEFTSLSGDVQDLALSVPASGDHQGAVASLGSAAASPRSAITGTPVFISESPEVPSILVGVVSFIVENEAEPSVSADRFEHVVSRAASFRNTVGEPDLIYYLESEGTTGHVLVRDRDGEWWHLWIYVEEGMVVDLEFLSVSEEE